MTEIELAANTPYLADLEQSGRLVYVEFTIPPGMTIDEYRRSRPQRRGRRHRYRLRTRSTDAQRS